MNINIPDEYKVKSKIPIKEFIPKFLKPEQKRRIRNSIKRKINNVCYRFICRIRL